MTRPSFLRSGFVLGLLLVSASAASAALAPIQLDGFFSDWATVSQLATDNTGDGGTVDFAGVWAANDQDYFYLRFETGGEVQPDEQQDIWLYVDTDMNAATGIGYGGIGAELVWQLGRRQGQFYGPSNAVNISHADVGLLIGPTFSNTEFEMALRRDALPNNLDPLFTGNQIRFILRDATSGDRMPDSGSLVYDIAAGNNAPPTLGLGRTDAADIRLASWNVENDGLFAGGAREAAQGRLLAAMDPNVLIVCEAWNHSANEVATIIEQHLPSGPGQTWYGLKFDSGNVIVSRYPILNRWAVKSGSRITAALLDLGAAAPTDLLVIANHWRCCTADNNRQAEADALVAFLKDARSAGGAISLPANTPILLGGDFNLVGWRQQFDTIITGNIINEGGYGADSPPDWDGTSLAVPPSRHPDGRASDTWRNPSSSFYPGTLDWIMYTDSVIFLKNHYILETRTMLPATLAATGLNLNDTVTASDHAPRVADFSLVNPATAVPGAGVGRLGARLLPNVPNPFNPSTRLQFSLVQAGNVTLTIYDVRGRMVREFDLGRQTHGTHSLRWDGTDTSGRSVASGVYRVRLVTRAGGRVEGDSQSIVLVE